MGLKEKRLAKGYTLHGLADVSGVNYQKIWQIEHAVIKPENITLKTALKLATALECPPAELLARTEEVIK